MRDLTLSDYQRMIEHYKKYLKIYFKFLENAQDEEFRLSLEESIEACFIGIEYAEQKYNELMNSENYFQ